MAQRVVVFFGEMGSGKSWCAERYAGDRGFCFFEGDSVVTHELLDRSGRFKPIPRGVIREFVQVLSRAVVEHAQQCDSATLVVSQALYLDEDRRAFEAYLVEHGLAVDWRWVRTPFFKHVRNLLTRPKRWRWVVYMLMNKPFFQAPTHRHLVFHNDG
jgi:hypothetical protein